MLAELYFPDIEVGPAQIVVEPLPDYRPNPIVWPKQHTAVWLLSTGLLGVQLCLSIVYVHDFLAWNQTRWNQVNAWLAEGYLPQDIDGGRDINAWFRSAEDSDTMWRPGDPGTWWCHHAKLSMAFGPRDGWQEIDRIQWQAWATGRMHEIVLLRHCGGTRGRSISKRHANEKSNVSLRQR